MKRKLSGKFVLRIGEALHADLSQQAHARAVSLNSLCVEKLAQKQAAFRDFGLGVDAVISSASSDWLAVIAFGSRVKGEARESSDVDLLIVLKSDVQLTPQLYRNWDKMFGEKLPKVSPHFVHIPTTANPSSLWLEVAISGLVLKDEALSAHRALIRVRELIARGEVSRKTLHGQPYWIWSQEKVG